MLGKLEQNVSSSNRLNATPDTFERAIIGCLLECDPEIAPKVAGQVALELISIPRNLHCFKVLRNAALAGTPLGYKTALAAISQAPGMLEHFSNEDDIEIFIEDCIEDSQPVTSWEMYVKELHLAYTRRKLMAAFDDATVSALGASNAEDAQADAISQVIEVAGELRRNSARESYDIDKVVDRYLEMYNSEEGSAIPFPQEQLNTLGGYRAGDIVVLCAATGGKKSWCALDWALDAFKSSGKSSRIYTMEMSEEEIINRMLSIEYGLDNEKIFNRKIDPETISEKLASLAEMPISIVDKRISPGRIISDLASMGEDRPDIVIVDHIDLFTWKEGNEVNALKGALANFKDAAKQYGVVFILVAQFRRPKNDDEGKHPNLSMLKGGSSIEQIASYVIFMNEELDRTQYGDYYTTMMWSAKQRHGKPAKKFSVEFENYKIR